MVSLSRDIVHHSYSIDCSVVVLSIDYEETFISTVGYGHFYRTVQDYRHTVINDVQILDT
jgi:hypothetical protein